MRKNLEGNIGAGEEAQVPKRSLRNKLQSILFPLALISAPVAYVTLLKVLFNDDLADVKSSSQTSASYNDGSTILDGLEAAAFYYDLFGDKGIQTLSKSGILQEIIRNYTP
ncbi:MAG: hypothetical protein PHH00_01020 [Candidatus Nanoarchaeia archaeon]|nr:hypothetical protein [Candidatus Nanoarchaeia archaeon]MDD5699761.1 hypothetical protein [Candidatus Nanoarchaeia archaeon]